jgi:hypothetical protein
LARFEKRIFERLTAAAPDGRFVPLASVADAYAREGWWWWDAFKREVREDAKKAGYTDDSWFSWSTAILLFGGFGVALLVSSLVLIPFHITVNPAFPEDMAEQQPSGWGIASFGCLCAMMEIALVIYLFWFHDFDGFTKAGDEATAHWLGVSAWLRAHEEYASTPAAGVAIWDRYLSQGVALGTNPVAAAAVDLRTGRHEQTWSPHGGTWRRITVAHPSVLSGYGTPAGFSLAWAAVALPIWSAAGWLVWQLDHAVKWYLLALIAWRALRNLYLAVRAIADLLSPVTVRGTLVSLRATAPHEEMAAQRDRMWLTSRPFFRDRMYREWYRAVVDTGATDRIKPWSIDRRATGGAEPGQQVIIIGQRRSHYARRMAVDPTAPPHRAIMNLPG